MAMEGQASSWSVIDSQKYPLIYYTCTVPLDVHDECEYFKFSHGGFQGY